MSVIIRDAFDQWKEMRDDFELYRHAQFHRAHEELRGNLLNSRGRHKGVDPYSLFLGPITQALAYASEELLEWWDADERNWRMTVMQFERQWLAQRAESWEESPW